jgi:hypothetical protein
VENGCCNTLSEKVHIALFLFRKFTTSLFLGGNPYESKYTAFKFASMYTASQCSPGLFFGCVLIINAAGYELTNRGSESVAYTP